MSVIAASVSLKNAVSSSQKLLTALSQLCVPVQEGGDEWESYDLLVVQLYEVGHVPGSVRSGWGVMEAVSPGVCAVRPGKRRACFVYRRWAFSTSACANVWHVTVSGLTEVHGAEFSSLSGGQPLLMFPNEPSKVTTFPKPIERKLSSPFWCKGELCLELVSSKVSLAPRERLEKTAKWCNLFNPWWVRASASSWNMSIWVARRVMVWRRILHFPLACFPHTCECRARDHTPHYAACFADTGLSFLLKQMPGVP